ncbi:MAG: heliorhodopsin HeR [Bacillota bacterium]|nr:heliorhodopsin HeR [Bacillota bacterium]
MLPLELQKLRKFNMIMGALHLIQGIMMIFLATTVIANIANFKPEIIQYYLDFIPGQGLVASSKVLFTLPFGILVACFLLLSAGAHALISIPKKTNAIYNADLAQGINKFRWFEYALSSSVMIVLISTLFGVYDIATLVLIFVVNASMNLFGLVMEQLNAGKAKGKLNWGPFVWGSFAGLAPWVVIILYMSGASSDVVNAVPWFVWAIVITYFIAFNTFPVNMVLQYKRVGKWSNYLYGERTYIVLSLVAKSLLAWLVLFGAMQP